MILKTTNDERRILSLRNDADFWLVGSLNVIEIRPYEENGHMAPVLWFAIYFKDSIEPLLRVSSGLNTVVEYFK